MFYICLITREFGPRIVSVARNLYVSPVNTRTDYTLKLVAVVLHQSSFGMLRVMLSLSRSRRVEPRVRFEQGIPSQL